MVGKPAGALVFVLDVLKGYLPPVAAVSLGLNAWWVVGAGFAAIMGHNFSPFLGFKGGKGVSTSLGALFGIAWKAGLTAWAVWGIVLGISGFVSLGSIVAAAILPGLSWFFHPGDWARFTFCVIAGLFSIYKHRGNIQRLRAGTELGFRSKPSEAGKERGEPDKPAPPDESDTTERPGESGSP